MIKDHNASKNWSTGFGTIELTDVNEALKLIKE